MGPPFDLVMGLPPVIGRRALPIQLGGPPHGGWGAGWSPILPQPKATGGGQAECGGTARRRKAEGIVVSPMTAHCAGPEGVSRETAQDMASVVRNFGPLVNPGSGALGTPTFCWTGNGGLLGTWGNAGGFFPATAAVDRWLPRSKWSPDATCKDAVPVLLELMGVFLHICQSIYSNACCVQGIV